MSATLLGAPAPRTDEWYALRRGGITATDLPRILGLSKYGNARSVWHAKRGELPDGGEQSEAGLWGDLLEEPVAQEWARRTGNEVTRVGILAHHEHPWMRASCDRLIAGQRAALEVKTRSAYVSGRWREEMPDDVLAQAAWQRIVGDFDRVEVACLLGGQQLATYRYEQDDELESYLIGAAANVWADVQTGTPPPVDMDGVLLKLLEQLYPNRAGQQAITQQQAIQLLVDYNGAQHAANEAARAKEAAKATILSLLGAAEVLTLDGEPIFTYRAQETSSVNVRDLEDNDPELYLKLLEGGHISTTKSRVLRAAKGAKNV